MIRGKRVLVTGGAGFIGSHLVDELLKYDNKVIVLDDFSCGSTKNLQNATLSRNYRLQKGTVTDKKIVTKLIARRGVDIVYHLAAGNLLTSIKNPHHDIDVTLHGTLNILDAIAQRSKNTILVYSSTGSVYGEPQYQPQDENHPQEPVSPYGITKLAAEKMVLLWHKIYKVKSVALRYYNVYGPRQNYGPTGGIISIFISRLLKELPPVIEGTGNQARCFTFITDVVRANILAAEKKDALGNALNIGTTEVTTINKLASLILKFFHKNIKPVYAKKRLGDIDEFRPSLRKAQKILGYKPQVKLKDGLKQTIQWITKNENAK